MYKFKYLFHSLEPVPLKMETVLLIFFLLFKFGYSFHTPALTPELDQPRYPLTDSAKNRMYCIWQGHLYGAVWWYNSADLTAGCHWDDTMFLPPAKQLLQLPSHKHNAGTGGTREGASTTSVLQSHQFISGTKLHLKKMAQLRLKHDQLQVFDIWTA